MRVHLVTLVFEKNQNHKNFLENFDLRDRLIKELRACLDNFSRF